MGILYQLKDGAYRNEEFIHHEFLSENEVIVITNNRVISANKGKTFSLEWMVKFKCTLKDFFSPKDMTEVSLAKLGILLRFSYEPKSAIIDCRDPDKALILYSKLGGAVKAFKEEHPNPKKKGSSKRAPRGLKRAASKQQGNVQLPE